MDTQSFKTASLAKEAVNKEWFIVDAENAVLGRLSSNVARVLRGKHKPSFTPHVDCGDNVIVVNADKIRLTGQKWDKKEFISHSGYPGGQKSQTARETLNKYPERLIERAVRGMLPKNKLGRQIFKSLHVYAGDSHPHEAQKPKTLTF